MPYNFGEMPEKKNENNTNIVKKILNYICVNRYVTPKKKAKI